MTTFELKPVDGRKSFYGKAIVTVEPDGTEILHSYNTAIIKRHPGGSMERLWSGWTATTGRHIKAFLRIEQSRIYRVTAGESKTR